MTRRRSLTMVPSWIKPFLLVAFAAIVTGACKTQGGMSGGTPSSGGMSSPSGGGMPPPSGGSSGGSQSGGSQSGGGQSGGQGDH